MKAVTGLPRVLQSLPRTSRKFIIINLILRWSISYHGDGGKIFKFNIDLGLKSF